jgi:hypothetical protein
MDETAKKILGIRKIPRRYGYALIGWCRERGHCYASAKIVSYRFIALGLEPETPAYGIIYGDLMSPVKRKSRSRKRS